MLCRLHMWLPEHFTRLYIGVTTLRGSTTDERDLGQNKQNRGLIYAEVIYILKADSSHSNFAACLPCQSVATLDTHMMQAADGSHRKMAKNIY